MRYISAGMSTRWCTIRYIVVRLVRSLCFPIVSLNNLDNSTYMHWASGNFEHLASAHGSVRHCAGVSSTSHSVKIESVTSWENEISKHSKSIAPILKEVCPINISLTSPWHHMWGPPTGVPVPLFPWKIGIFPCSPKSIPWFFYVSCSQKTAFVPLFPSF